MHFGLASQFMYEYRSLTTSYPEFVKHKHGQLASDEIPVFVFHTIKPDEFESELRYLSENGYVSLSIEDYYLAITKQKTPPERSVLLTVDDARLSFWVFGYPLLKKYNATVTLFVIPGLTEDGDARPSGLDQNYDCKTDTAICNWSELDELDASGLVDIESHSLFHQQIFIDTRVIDFIGPNTPRYAYHTPFSAYLKPEDARQKINYDRILGMPIFESDSRMSGRPAILIPESLRHRAREIYERHYSETRLGDAKKKDVIRLLRAAVSQEQIRYETRDQVLGAIEGDLRKATDILKLRLGPDRGDHFCLPFTIGSDEMLIAAKRIGLKTCFWGSIPGRSKNSPGSDPYRSVRLKHDFIFRLPGTNRLSLPGIYYRKIKRRMSGEPVY